MSSEQAAITERKQLNIEVAKALGYRVVNSGNLSSLLMPDGETLYRCGGIFAEESMFHDVFAARMIPNYAKDLNAAWSLPIEAGTNLELCKVSEDVHLARVCITVSSRLSEAQPEYVVAKTPALAVCRAWIAWKLWQEGGAK